MTRRLPTALTAALALVMAAPAPAQKLGPQRHVLAVLAFDEQGEISPGSGQVAAELLEIGLVKTGRFEIVERGRLESVTSELELGLTGLVSEQTAQKIGEIVGAEVIIMGSVYRLEGVTGITTKLISTRDASLITADRAQSRGRPTLDALVDLILPLIIEDFPLRGMVIERIGDTAVIDLGDNVGLIPGREFKVYRFGKEYRRPTTNELLDREEIEKGVLEVLEVRDLTARCKIVIEDPPGSIQREDLIKSIGFEIDTTREPATLAAAEPEPAAATSWEEIPGAPTMLMLQVHNRSGGAASAFSDTLRSAVGDELHAQRVANPVLTDLPGSGSMSDVLIPSEYASGRPYLMRLIIKEFEFDRDGDVEIEIACRVYDPREDDVIYRKSFSVEKDGRAYSDRDSLLTELRMRIVQHVARVLPTKFN